ncbi:hypothetical protein, partial [Streptomyces sp. NPDC056154]|uniref:hypothetical protein n=1 Tax=Streptomyces sp. NPDC056154 TaxID=3345729 RepID=UPI0035D5637B
AVDPRLNVLTVHIAVISGVLVKGGVSPIGGQGVRQMLLPDNIINFQLDSKERELMIRWSVRATS